MIVRFSDLNRKRKLSRNGWGSIFNCREIFRLGRRTAPAVNQDRRSDVEPRGAHFGDERLPSSGLLEKVRPQKVDEPATFVLAQGKHDT
jgi:hypothetical protein